MPFKVLTLSTHCLFAAPHDLLELGARNKGTTTPLQKSLDIKSQQQHITVYHFEREDNVDEWSEIGFRPLSTLRPSGMHAESENSRMKGGWCYVQSICQRRFSASPNRD